MSRISKRRIERLVESGLKVPEIAKQLGVVPQTVYKLFAEYGIKYDRSRKHSEDEVKKVQELLDSGLSSEEVAMQMGLSYNAVRYLIRRYQLKTSNIHASRKPNRTQILKRQYREEHMSIADMAKLWDCSEEEMRKYLEAHRIIPSSHVVIPQKFKKQKQKQNEFNMNSWYRTCAVCGKKFSVIDAGEYAYKLKEHDMNMKFFCSWGHIQAYRRGEKHEV